MIHKIIKDQIESLCKQRGYETEETLFVNHDDRRMSLYDKKSKILIIVNFNNFTDDEIVNQSNLWKIYKTNLLNKYHSLHNPKNNDDSEDDEDNEELLINNLYIDSLDANNHEAYAENLDKDILNVESLIIHIDANNS